MNQNKTAKTLAILGMIIIAIIFSIMPTTQILGISLIPVRIPPQVIEVETRAGTVHFDIPPLDLREFPVDHFQVEQWFLERLNYHRANAALSPFSLDAQATVASIEHSIDMRDHQFTGAYTSDGRTVEERLGIWISDEREKASIALGFYVHDELCQDIVSQIVDHLFFDEERSFLLLSPHFRYIGVGTSLDKDGIGSLSITLIGENN